MPASALAASLWPDRPRELELALMLEDLRREFEADRSHCLMPCLAVELIAAYYWGGQEAPGVAALADRFNYAVAQWGHIEVPSAQLFERVIEKHREQSDNVALRNTPNVLQCIGLSYAILDQPGLARDHLVQARAALGKNPTRIFSCWRYLETDPDQFAADIAEMGRFVAGAKVMPVFMQSGRDAFLPLNHAVEPPVAAYRPTAQ